MYIGTHYSVCSNNHQYINTTHIDNTYYYMLTYH